MQMINCQNIDFVKALIPARSAKNFDKNLFDTRRVFGALSIQTA